MKYKVIKPERVINGLMNIHDWYEDHLGVAKADAVISKINNVIESLSSNPQRRRFWNGSSYRFSPVPKAKFNVFFDVNEQEKSVTILGVYPPDRSA